MVTVPISGADFSKKWGGLQSRGWLCAGVLGLSGKGELTLCPIAVPL